MKLRNKIDNILGKFLILILGLIVLNILWQIVTMFLLDSPSSFTDELARYLMIWCFLLGLAYISGRKFNIDIYLLPKKLNNQKKVKYFINIGIVIFCFLAFIVGGFKIVYTNFILDSKSASLQIPLSLIYLIIPVSGILIVYYKIYDLSLYSKELEHMNR